MTDCRDCTDYRKCKGKEWFHYGEIKWCPYQVIWILQNLEEFREGRWPQDPNGSVDQSIRSGFRSEAYYTKPGEVLGEVEARDIAGKINERLLTTTDAGRALIDELKWGSDITKLSRPAKEVLMYLKGWRRKKSSFSQWRSSRNYYKNLTKVS
jgi:hypothetical protein